MANEFSSEAVWEEILSEEPERIRQAYHNLINDDERDAVYRHLQKMVSDDGYTDGQQEAAQAALDTIQPLR